MTVDDETFNDFIILNDQRDHEIFNKTKHLILNHLKKTNNLHISFDNELDSYVVNNNNNNNAKENESSSSSSSCAYNQTIQPQQQQQQKIEPKTAAAKNNNSRRSSMAKPTTRAVEQVLVSNKHLNIITSEPNSSSFLSRSNLYIILTVLVLSMAFNYLMINYYQLNKTGGRIKISSNDNLPAIEHDRRRSNALFNRQLIEQQHSIVEESVATDVDQHDPNTNYRDHLRSSNEQPFYDSRQFSLKSYEHVAFPTFSFHKQEIVDNSNNHQQQQQQEQQPQQQEAQKKTEREQEEKSSSVIGSSHEEVMSSELTRVVGIRHLQDRLKNNSNKKVESQMALHLALKMLNDGKFKKASKLYRYALSLDPANSDALASYGEFLETHRNDVVKAEHFYARALKCEPQHDRALSNRKRALPLVHKIDRELLDKIDNLLKEFYQIPTSSSALKRAKRDAYFMHIYHSNAIEGNTLNLQQTRHILENRMTISGKSIIEHQEVLGLDAAMRYINETLLYKTDSGITLDDIRQIHKRVLGFCDPVDSGSFRKHQVYVGKFVPPPPNEVLSLMNEFIDWLNSKDLLADAHPIQVAALAHYKFVYIHPFYDGNGRTGRLLMNLILMKAGYPPVIIRKQDRMDYYEYLEMANQGDVKPFIRFIAKCTQRTLTEYIRLCNDSHSLDFERHNELMRNEEKSAYWDNLFNENVNDYDDDDKMKSDSSRSSSSSFDSTHSDDVDEDEDPKIIITEDTREYDPLNEKLINNENYIFTQEVQQNEKQNN